MRYKVGTIIGIATVLTVLMGAGFVVAQSNQTGTGTTSQYGWVLAIVGGFIQLVIGIVLAVASIYFGLNVLGRLIPKIEIWKELKGGNHAVGIVCAGVVVAYTQVITSGIRGMSAAVSTEPSLMGFIAGLISVVFGIAFASLGVTLAFKALDKLTKDINETEELKNKNLAFGILIAGILFGISSMIAAAVSGIGEALAAGLGGGAAGYV